MVSNPDRNYQSAGLLRLYITPHPAETSLFLFLFLSPMASAFQERLDHMEQTRNQRLSLLQAEREAQNAKSQQLAAKQTNIRSAEQRCFKLDQKIASQRFVISSLNSQIDQLDSNYDRTLRQIRVLKSEMEELEELKKEKEKSYSLNKNEMEEFSAQVDFFVVDCEVQVQELRSGVNELKSSFVKLQGSAACLNNSEIAAAEVRKSELIASKGNLDRSLASNYKIRAQLQKQLHRILMDKTKKDGH